MQKLFRGGGTIADTLNDVPKAINEMIKENYKKIADITCDKTISKDYAVKIPLNLSFRPSKVIFLISAESIYGETEETWVNTEDYNETDGVIFSMYGNVTLTGYFLDKPIITEKEMILKINYSLYSDSRIPKIVRCIAIE